MKEASSSPQEHVQASVTPLIVLDVARSVDLDRADKILEARAARRRLTHQKRAPQDEGLRPLPLKVTLPGVPVAVEGVQTEAAAVGYLYEFGGLCVHYRVSFDGTLEELGALSHAFYENVALAADAQKRALELLGILGAAADQPDISAIDEDYLVVQLYPAHFSEPEAYVQSHAAHLTRILRPDTEPPSRFEIEDATSRYLSYGLRDLTLIDWFSALLIGDDLQDELTVLEYGIVELLQLRLLDHRLDQGIDEAYNLLTRTERWTSAFSLRSDGVKRVSELQVESALLFEGIDNPFKLVGDQYLARLYDRISERFHLGHWDAAIERKLQTLNSIYTKLADRAAHHRAEVLEWIVIVLIALSIGVYFLPGGGH